jgi:hypothetical protein
MSVIAYVSDLWRKRFGWDRASGGWDIPKDVEPLATLHTCTYAEDMLRAHGIDPEAFRAVLSSSAPAVTVTINALDGASVADFIRRSTPAKEK